MDQFLWAFSQSHMSVGDPVAQQNLKGDLRQLSRESGQAKRDIEQLEEKVRHLELISRSIWQLLKDCSDLTEEDLLEIVRELDQLEEPTAPRDCPACHRLNSFKRRNCLYCGHALPEDSAFEKL